MLLIATTTPAAHDLRLTEQLGGGTYVGMGVALGRRAGGRHGLSAHPHFVHWREIHLLCRDGLAYARSSGHQRPRRAGYERMSETGSDKDTARQCRGRERPAKKEKRHSSKRNKNEEKGQKHDEAHSASVPHVVPDDDVKRDNAATVSHPSSGGGRWVHVPG